MMLSPSSKCSQPRTLTLTLFHQYRPAHQKLVIMSNPLDPTALLALLPTLLPRSTSSPLPHPTDAVAALVHSIHISLDFRVTTAPTISQPRFTSDQHIDTAASAQTDVDDGASDTATAVDQEEDAASVAGQLPPGWNGRGEDSYSFEYRHAQSSMVFRVRVGRMGGRVQVDAMAEVSQALPCTSNPADRLLRMDHPTVCPSYWPTLSLHQPSPFQAQLPRQDRAPALRKLRRNLWDSSRLRGLSSRESKRSSRVDVVLASRRL